MGLCPKDARKRRMAPLGTGKPLIQFLQSRLDTQKAARTSGRQGTCRGAGVVALWRTGAEHVRARGPGTSH